MAIPPNDVAQRPLNQNSKPITGVPVPLVPSSPVTVPQMNTRSVISGVGFIVAGPGTIPLIVGLPVPVGVRLWSALNPTDVSAPFIFGDCPTSMLFIRFIKLGGLLNVDLVNLDAAPHTVDWAVGFVAANTALIPGATP